MKVIRTVRKLIPAFFFIDVKANSADFNGENRFRDSLEHVESNVTKHIGLLEIGGGSRRKPRIVPTTQCKKRTALFPHYTNAILGWCTESETLQWKGGCTTRCFIDDIDDISSEYYSRRLYYFW